jgi:iron only hydrogenase large subunit-like protein
MAGIKLEGCKKEWSFLEGIELKCAVAHGLVNARTLMNGVKSGELEVHFIEVMACPGGCLGGGGQPIPTNEEIRRKRTEAIYAEDMSLPIRKSHENPEIVAIYKEFLGAPLGHKSHELLHTHYRERVRY